MNAASPPVDAQACCLIRPVSELIVRGVVLLHVADHASFTNDVIPSAKHSMKRAGQWFWKPSNRYSWQPEWKGREGSREREIV